MYRKVFYVLTVGIFALVMTIVPALASGNDIVINGSETMSKTFAYSSSNTGTNLAYGSYGGEGGNGGVIEAGDVDESSTGNGGDGGDSGVGGTVITGDALAVTDVTTEAGDNTTRINRCACENEDECGDGGNVFVFNRTRTISMVFAGADANTDKNKAYGSSAGNGGNGGDLLSDDYGKQDDNSEVEESSTGNGGNGGASSEGGLVQSGDSTSRTTVVNVLNRNTTRIFR